MDTTATRKLVCELKVVGWFGIGIGDADFTYDGGRWSEAEVEAMEADSNVKLDVLRCDGGMVEDELLMQFQADILNRPVVRPVTKDATTALGAAYAAGLAVGFFKNTDDLRSNWQLDRSWNPQLDAAKRDEMYRFWKRAVSRTFDWLQD